MCMHAHVCVHTSACMRKVCAREHGDSVSNTFVLNSSSKLLSILSEKPKTKPDDAGGGSQLRQS